VKPSQNKYLLYWHDKPKEPNKEGPLTFLLFEPQFTSVSTVGRIHPSLVSLRFTLEAVEAKGRLLALEPLLRTFLMLRKQIGT
jgi:hypothetical protein